MYEKIHNLLQRILGLFPLALLLTLLEEISIEQNAFDMLMLSCSM